jgi:hypothetical protein
MGTTPTVIDLTRNYAFQEAHELVRAWPHKAFKDHLCHKKIAHYSTTGKVKVIPYAPIWLSSEMAERCDGVTFNPAKPCIYNSQHNDRLFNLYRGLQIKPQKGDWGPIKNAA